MRKRLSYANVVSTLALFAALTTGGAYAANTIGSADVIDESLQSQDIKNLQVKNTDLASNSVSLSKIASGSVTSPKLAADSVTSDKVPDFGLSNEDIGVLFARVNSDGSLSNASSTAVSAVRIAGGSYEVDFGRDVTACAAVVTQGEAAAGSAAGAITGVTNRSGNTDAKFVTTRSDSGVQLDESFQIVVVC